MKQSLEDREIINRIKTLPSYRLISPIKQLSMEESYGTLSETINGLKREGYMLDFNIREEYLVCHQADKILSPDDFEINKVDRFEGESNPDDQSILYTISSPKFGTKRLLVNGYGISSEEITNTVIEKLKTHKLKIE